MQPLTLTAVAAGDVLLGATVTEDRVTYTLRAHDGQPLTHLQWLGQSGAELLLGGVPCDLWQLADARNRLREDAAMALHRQGWSMRRIAALLGVAHQQVARWVRDS